MSNDVLDNLKLVDKKLRKMKKAELLRYARRLTLELMELLRTTEDVMGTANTAVDKVGFYSFEALKGKKKARKSSDKTNRGKKEFWGAWQGRYLELRTKEDMKPMAARRKVNKEIKERTGKSFSEDTLKRQLKD